MNHKFSINLNLLTVLIWLPLTTGQEDLAILVMLTLSSQIKHKLTDWSSLNWEMDFLLLTSNTLRTEDQLKSLKLSSSTWHNNSSSYIFPCQTLPFSLLFPSIINTMTLPLDTGRLKSLLPPATSTPSKSTSISTKQEPLSLTKLAEFSTDTDFMNQKTTSRHSMDTSLWDKGYQHLCTFSLGTANLCSQFMIHVKNGCSILKQEDKKEMKHIWRVLMFL